MAIDWWLEQELVEYEDALNLMEERVEQIYNHASRELVWLLEHPSLYTAGSSSHINELLDPNLLPVFNTGRGGKYTYHGPGQKVGYVMLNLKERAAPLNPDLRAYIYQLESWVINSLAEMGVKAGRREGRIGIWVIKNNGEEAKIAAIGVRIRKWVSYHGVALNINPNLTYFNSIIPCGISNYGVTSLAELGYDIECKQIDIILKEQFIKIFGE